MLPSLAGRIASLMLLSTPAPKEPGEAVAQAVARGLTVIQKAAANYPRHRDCFACHHQTLPMLGMAKAQAGGTLIDAELLRQQADFTRRSFEPRQADMRRGMGIGGRAMTVGYGLWALAIADGKPDETTAAMVAFLLKTQKEEGHWARQTIRPPLEESNVMCTVLAIQGLQKYARKDQVEAAATAIARAKVWLAATTLESQEDKVARLWSLHLLQESAEAIASARVEVLGGQRQDGGWGQLDALPSDAYATGQALFVLQATGLPVADPAYQRGIAFLLRTQKDDGSWPGETRSRPIQTYFDNGDPGGKHQFIVIPATSWAVAALAATLKPPSALPRRAP